MKPRDSLSRVLDITRSNLIVRFCDCLDGMPVTTLPSLNRRDSTPRVLSWHQEAIPPPATTWTSCPFQGPSLTPCVSPTQSRPTRSFSAAFLAFARRLRTHRIHHLLGPHIRLPTQPIPRHGHIQIRLLLHDIHAWVHFFHVDPARISDALGRGDPEGIEDADAGVCAVDGGNGGEGKLRGDVGVKGARHGGKGR